MQKVFPALALVSGLIILAACASPASQQGGGGDLTGKIWMLTQLNGSNPVPDTQISAEFGTDGMVSGSAGCNRYSGKYTTSGSSIEISSAMASTMMACPDPVMQQETDYFQALGAAKTFTVNGDQLTLNDSSGKAVANFQAQSQDLSGTSWLVTGYNNGNQAVVSVINGTEITADFGADGNIGGSSGCNTYSGPYKVDGDKITIGPLASTMMFCSDPEGVMDQESQYLAALQTAATYEISGNSLQMRTADDALAATFSRK